MKMDKAVMMVKKPFPEILYVSDTCESDPPFDGYPDLSRFESGDELAVYRLERVAIAKVRRQVDLEDIPGEAR